MLINYELQFDYTMMNEVMIVVKRFGCTIIKNETQLFCQMTIGIPKEKLEQCLAKLNDMHGVEVNKLIG